MCIEISFVIVALKYLFFLLIGNYDVMYLSLVEVSGGGLVGPPMPRALESRRRQAATLVPVPF